MKIDMNELPKYAAQALQKPDDFGYWGYDDMFLTWGFTGIDKNDASDLLEQSNFEVISKQLMEEYPDDFRIETYKHWAVNSVDRLVCRILKEPGEIVNLNITDAFRTAMDWHNELDNYSIADEEHYLRMEFDYAIELIKDMDSDLLQLINTESEDWAEDIYYQLTMNMGIDIVNEYVKNDDIQMSVYVMQLWNLDAIEEWNEWTDRNNLERIPFRKENPNQLKLFED
jgi:hypothetical protein